MKRIVGCEQMANSRRHGQLTRERSLLRVVTLKHDPTRCIDNTIRGNRWVVGDLLNGERRQSTSLPVWPVTVEKPAVGTTRACLRYVIRSSRDHERGRGWPK